MKGNSYASWFVHKASVSRTACRVLPLRSDVASAEKTYKLVTEMRARPSPGTNELQCFKHSLIFEIHPYRSAILQLLH